MEIKKIFVAGAGLMGGGITQVCAQAGYDVTLRDMTAEILEKTPPTDLNAMLRKGRTWTVASA